MCRGFLRPMRFCSMNEMRHRNDGNSQQILQMHRELFMIIALNSICCDVSLHEIYFSTISDIEMSYRLEYQRMNCMSAKSEMETPTSVDNLAERRKKTRFRSEKIANSEREI